MLIRAYLTKHHRLYNTFVLTDCSFRCCFLSGIGLWERNLRCSQNDFDLEFLLFGRFIILRRQPLIFTSSLSLSLSSSFSCLTCRSFFSTFEFTSISCFSGVSGLVFISSILEVLYVDGTYFKLLLRRIPCCSWFAFELFSNRL